MRFEFQNISHIRKLFNTASKVNSKFSITHCRTHKAKRDVWNRKLFNNACRLLNRVFPESDCSIQNLKNVYHMNQRSIIMYLTQKQLMLLVTSRNLKMILTIEALNYQSMTYYVQKVRKARSILRWLFVNWNSTSMIPTILSSAFSLTNHSHWLNN
jgi:hypothetical protein